MTHGPELEVICQGVCSARRITWTPEATRWATTETVAETTAAKTAVFATTTPVVQALVHLCW